MKTGCTAIVLLLFLSSASLAQHEDKNLLFWDQHPLEIKLDYSFKTLRSNTGGNRYIPTYLYYKIEKEAWDSVGIEIRARGRFRRKHCYFTPIRIRIKSEGAKGTWFEGNNNLKLVLPCQPGKSAKDWLLKEYLCYKLYELISPYYFNTRLLDLNLTDKRNRKPKSYGLKAFFIEDEDLVNKRFEGKMVKEVSINPLLLQDTISTKHDFFQFMIANTDWSTVAQHNIRIMQLPSRTRVPVPYDFDMAGLVNTKYSQVSELLPIRSVRERLYRGFCRNEGLFEFVRGEYLSIEDKFWEVFSLIDTEISPNELGRLQNYLDEFFEILKNDQKYKENILQKCRTTQ